MNRSLSIIISALAVGALALVPGVASARHGHGENRGHHQQGHHQRGHHQRGRGLEVSGTVDSFTAGVLTIKQADGTLVNGLVGRSTEIECDTVTAPPSFGAPAQTRRHGADDATGTAQTSSGADNGAEASEPAEANEANEPAEANEANDPAETGDTHATTPEAQNSERSGSGGHETPSAGCDSSALKPGVAVSRARLRDKGNGPAFKKIRLEIVG